MMTPTRAVTLCSSACDDPSDHAAAPAASRGGPLMLASASSRLDSLGLGRESVWSTPLGDACGPLLVRQGPRLLRRAFAAFLAPSAEPGGSMRPTNHVLSCRSNDPGAQLQSRAAVTQPAVPLTAGG